MTEIRSGVPMMNVMKRGAPLRTEEPLCWSARRKDFLSAREGFIPESAESRLEASFRGRDVQEWRPMMNVMNARATLRVEKGGAPGPA
jgi:hypothetical protein